ncbi:MAG: PBECR2 nuclease fold domain-containing protein [Burkholderiales bacterium]
MSAPPRARHPNAAETTPRSIAPARPPPTAPRIGKPAVFKDVLGEPLTINERLFQSAAGEWKLEKDDRHRYLLLLADTIKSPDEIWAYWEPLRDTPGKSRLVRRYIKAFDLADQQQFGYGVFELRDEGWTGTTLFMPRQDRSDAVRLRYINNQRAGSIIYRKGGVRI